MVENVPSFASDNLRSVLNNGVCGRNFDDSAGDTRVVLEQESKSTSSSSDLMKAFDLPRPGVRGKFEGVGRYLESPCIEFLFERSISICNLLGPSFRFEYGFRGVTGDRQLISKLLRNGVETVDIASPRNDLD